uniref:uncharacterized protein LOC122583400 n=1 Tax=Erigeron canadensis TaxID=72917 RepID=UPI001CB957C1|nr:uncharacterized protein LOC122583400 [Erigeron canadensis]
MAYNRSSADDFFNAAYNFVPANSSTGAHSSDTSPSTPQYPPFTPPLFGQPYYPTYQNDPNFLQWQEYQQFLLSQQTRTTPPIKSIPEIPQTVPQTQTVAEPQPETQPESSTRRKKGKGKNVAGEKVIRKPKVAWSGEEEKHLALCWLDVSEDPIVGNSQTGDCLWNKVFDKYNAAVQIKHRPDQIKGKWRLIKE